MEAANGSDGDKEGQSAHGMDERKCVCRSRGRMYSVLCIFPQPQEALLSCSHSRTLGNKSGADVEEVFAAFEDPHPHESAMARGALEVVQKSLLGYTTLTYTTRTQARPA